MPFPPNYNQHRRDRERAKDQKSREKQARREEKSLLRKESRVGEEQPDTGPANETEKN